MSKEALTLYARLKQNKSLDLDKLPWDAIISAEELVQAGFAKYYGPKYLIMTAKAPKESA